MGCPNLHCSSLATIVASQSCQSHCSFHNFLSFVPSYPLAVAINQSLPAVMSRIDHSPGFRQAIGRNHLQNLASAGWASVGLAFTIGKRYIMATVVDACQTDSAVVVVFRSFLA